MATTPVVLPNSVAVTAKRHWDAAITTYGRTVDLIPNDEQEEPSLRVKAFCTRPKILGLFDRTEQSYDQSRYTVQLRAQDVSAGRIHKFDRVRWDGIEHAVLSVTEVVLSDVLIGYRVLTKG